MAMPPRALRTSQYSDALRRVKAWSGMRLKVRRSGVTIPRALGRPEAALFFGEGKAREAVAVIKISVREDESLESVLKRFKRICDKEGIKKALKQYSYYEKPSD